MRVRMMDFEMVLVWVLYLMSILNYLKLVLLKVVLVELNGLRILRRKVGRKVMSRLLMKVFVIVLCCLLVVFL